MTDRPDLAALWPMEPVDTLPADAMPAAIAHFAALQARAAARLVTRLAEKAERQRAAADADDEPPAGDD